MINHLRCLFMKVFYLNAVIKFIYAQININAIFMKNVYEYNIQFNCFYISLVKLSYYIIIMLHFSYYCCVCIKCQINII